MAEQTRPEHDRARPVAPPLEAPARCEPISPPDFASRRVFILAGLGMLVAGCAQSKQTADLLPGPAWDARPVPPAPAPEPYVTKGASPNSVPVVRDTLPRSSWATGQPVPTLMDPMQPVRFITVHHDGMQPFYGDDRRAASGRLDAIRRGHRRENWGDIGYHFAVDRAGNVWDGRPLRYQGAHVKDHNVGNVGIVMLGNFDRQRPTEAQIRALNAHLSQLMRLYRVPIRNVRTHQEWAPTRCPGHQLQAQMVRVRASGELG